MGDTSGGGGAGGGIGLAGGGGQIRRTILSTSLRPGDEVYFANPDKREVKRRKKAYEAQIEKGAMPTKEKSMLVGNLRAKITAVKNEGQGYDVEIRKGNEQLIEKFSPKSAKGRKRGAVRRLSAYAFEMRGGMVLRDGVWRYKVKV